MKAIDDDKENLIKHQPPNPNQSSQCSPNFLQVPKVVEVEVMGSNTKEVFTKST